MRRRPSPGALASSNARRSVRAASAIADGGYAVEAFGRLVFGATFEAAQGEPQVTEGARAENLETLARLRPGLDPGRVTSRASIRATTPDRCPFAVRRARPDAGAEAEK